MREADFVKIAKALADPTRYQILERVRARGELTCSDICGECTQSQPTVSHHLKTLERAGLLKVRKDGQFHVLTADEDLLRAFAARLVPPGARGRPRARKRTLA